MSRYFERPLGYQRNPLSVEISRFSQERLDYRCYNDIMDRDLYHQEVPLVPYIDYSGPTADPPPIPLGPGIKVSLNELLSQIDVFCVQHCCTQLARKDLCSIINSTLPAEFGITLAEMNESLERSSWFLLIFRDDFAYLYFCDLHSSFKCRNCPLDSYLVYRSIVNILKDIVTGFFTVFKLTK